MDTTPDEILIVGLPLSVKLSLLYLNAATTTAFNTHLRLCVSAALTGLVWCMLDSLFVLPTIGAWVGLVLAKAVLLWRTSRLACWGVA